MVVAADEQGRTDTAAAGGRQAGSAPDCPVVAPTFARSERAYCDRFTQVLLYYADVCKKFTQTVNYLDERLSGRVGITIERGVLRISEVPLQLRLAPRTSTRRFERYAGFHGAEAFVRRGHEWRLVSLHASWLSGFS